VGSERDTGVMEKEGRGGEKSRIGGDVKDRRRIRKTD
jgi:hypothetical protein